MLPQLPILALPPPPPPEADHRLPLMCRRVDVHFIAHLPTPPPSYHGRGPAAAGGPAAASDRLPRFGCHRCPAAPGPAHHRWAVDATCRSCSYAVTQPASGWLPLRSISISAIILPPPSAADDLRAEAAAAAARKGGGSGRSSVTLADLVGAGLLAPCSGCITVSYKHLTWTADLAADGAIEFEGGCTPRAGCKPMHHSLLLVQACHSLVGCCCGVCA